MPPMPLLLASTSPYRRQLLERLQLPFDCLAPDVDETPRDDEAPPARALRLAEAKAAAIAVRYPGAIVIGSDQVASLGEGSAAQILRKPGTPQRWAVQLATLSGQVARFDTAVCVRWPGGQASHVDLTRVHFRTLSSADIERYMAREAALDCAGGFKCEGLGISLMTRLESADPTGLIGLPLIWVAATLREAGLAVP
jgi:septum formation protein